MMATVTFVEDVKQQNPSTSHESLLMCSQVKADMTETPHNTAFENFSVSRAREHITFLKMSKIKKNAN